MTLQSALEEIAAHVADLELELSRARGRVNELLQDEAVRGLPSYRLLVNKYGYNEVLLDTQHGAETVPIREVELPVVSPDSIKDIVYDCIYQPPSLRHAPKRKKPERVEPVAVEAPKQQAKPAAATVAASAVVEGMLYQVELNKVKYYLHQGYIYNSSLDKVGYIGFGEFVFNDRKIKPVPIKELAALTALSDHTGYWKDADGVVYIQATLSVYHGIGTYDAGDINLWVPDEVEETECLF